MSSSAALRLAIRDVLRKLESESNSKAQTTKAKHVFSVTRIYRELCEMFDLPRIKPPEESISTIRDWLNLIRKVSRNDPEIRLAPGKPLDRFFVNAP